MTRQQEKDLAWLQVCFDISELATCARRATGCVLVDKNNHVLSASWNGVPKGMPHCTDSPCEGVHLPSGTGLSTCEAIHAEENALQLCPDISRIETIYCTTSPCLDRCLRKLINTGASRIVFANQYPDPQQLGKTKWESSGAGRKWVNQIMYDRVWLLNSPENALPAGLYYARQKDKPWHKNTQFLDGKTFSTGDYTLYQLVRKPTYDRRMSI
jgi:dCMP deaminase